MSEEARQNLLSLAEELLEEGRHDQALACLTPLECIEATYLTGKIYIDFAEKVSESFMFKYMDAEEIKEQHLHVLNQACEHLENSRKMLDKADYKTKLMMTTRIHRGIARTEQQLTLIGKLPNPTQAVKKSGHRKKKASAIAHEQEA